MPTRRYALDKGEPERLELSWRGLWKDFTIRLDGNVVGTMSGQKELKAGRAFALPDGSALRVQLVQKLSTAELEVLRDGEPLPGSASDPSRRVATAYSVMFFVGGLNVVLGLLAGLLQVEFLMSLGIGVSSVVFGLVFLALGFFVRRRSAAALIIGIVLFVLDGILGLVLTVSQGLTPGIGGVIGRVVLIIPMIQGVGALRALRQEGPPARMSN